MLGVQPDGLAEIGDRLVSVAVPVVGQAPLVVRPGMLGVQPDGLAEVRDRRIGLALLPVGQGQVVIRLGTFRLEPDGLDARGEALACRSTPAQAGRKAFQEVDERHDLLSLLPHHTIYRGSLADGGAVGKGGKG